ncbi:diaminopimelate decarboxylase [Eubacterium pyruvativorans]|uniref:diaminopimelate decarboxylase n=1 Tax=Eubacterium pyruvativorans TaxID=155865 RepID=UPI003F8B0898
MNLLYDNLNINEAGHLTIGGVDAVSLAEEYGTPLYVLDENIIRKKCRIYTEAMTRYFGNGSVPLFAGKALCFKGIYPIVEEEGLSADVVSPGEIYTALAAGFPAEKIYFHGNNKTDQDIRYGLEQHIGYFIVDNLNELRILNETAGEMGVKQKILLRVTVGLDPHTLDAINTGKIDSQFGRAIETGQAEESVVQALACENLELCGYHTHIGSQIFESDPFCDQIDILLGFADDMRRKHGYTAGVFNIGGGFGVRYTESDPEVDIAENIRQISEHLKSHCEERNYPLPHVLMEPGRSIVADAGVTLYTTGGVKEIEGYRNYVMVDGGMTDNPRYALYQSAYTIVLANRMNDTADFRCTVAGRCCETGDRLAEDILLPKANRGDIVAVLTTGAYNYSMASNYNRIPRPAIVMVKDGAARLVVRRETFQDLIEREL